MTYEALNGLNFVAADIQNVYLMAYTTEKHYIIYDPKFGSENTGNKAIVKISQYGTKPEKRDFRNYLNDCMGHHR